MNIEQIKQFIAANIKYKDGWEFHVGEKEGTMFLQMRFYEACHCTGNIELQTCRKYQLSEFMTETEIVRTCFLAVTRAEMHEIEEIFKYRGFDIFNSHINVNVLAKLCEEKGDDLFDLRKASCDSSSKISELPKKADIPILDMNGKYSGRTWNDHLDYGIIDPDGWDRSTTAYSDMKINFTEFKHRAASSTCLARKNHE